MAHLSGDEGLLSAFSEDRDVHQATAAEVFSVPLESVTSDQRRAAKTINFGLIYGMSPFGLARNLGIDRGSAQRYVERYFARYPGVKRFMDETPPKRARNWVRRDRLRSTSLPSRYPIRQCRHAAVRGAQRNQRPHARHRSRHHQAGDDRGGCLVSTGRRTRASNNAGTRRIGAGGPYGRGGKCSFSDTRTDDYGR